MAKKNKSMENYMENVENLVKSRVVFKKNIFGVWKTFQKTCQDLFGK